MSRHITQLTQYMQMMVDIGRDPSASTWLKTAAMTQGDRDPADAVNDARILLRLCQIRLAEIQQQEHAQEQEENGG